ncbi:MAG: M20 family metallopeptidase [Oscillospiraceae bacterium]|nr:M20 family metallopeptidase [Oscillospiraceae bacterium]
MADKKIVEALADQWIADHKQEMVEELKKWVSHPSVSRADLAAPGAPFGPDCRKMLDFALERCASYGFKTEDFEGYCGAATYGESKDEIGMVCHLDVVPEGNFWIHQPYAPIEKEGFLIGRGVGDNKGPGVMCLFLMRFFKENNIPLRNTLRLMLGCAEETGMADFAHYVEHKMGPIPAVSLIADAGFPACYAQKGGYNAAFSIPAGKNIVNFVGGSVRNAIPDTAVLTVSGITLADAQKALEGVERISLEADGQNVKITGHGKAGHAANPAEDVQNSAIVIAAAAAALLEEKTGLDLSGCKTIAHAFVDAFGTNLGIAYADEQSGKLTINAGVIQMEGGKLHLDIDIRFPVTMKSETITTGMESYLNANGADLIEANISNPYYIDPQDPKVTALLSAYRSVTGDMSEPYAMGGGTYSRVVPGGITFGPGMRKMGHKPEFLPEGHGGAHGPDEALCIQDWLTAFKIYILSVAQLDEVTGED